MKVTDGTELMVRAVNIFNRAIATSGDEFPYKHMSAVAEELGSGKPVVIAVYAEDPDKPHAFHTVRWSNKQLELLNGHEPYTGKMWKVPESFLQDVVENEEDYVHRPDKIDWDGIMARLGITGTG